MQKKRVFACLLALVMVLSAAWCAPAAFAEQPASAADFVYGGDASQVTDSDLAQFLEGCVLNEPTARMRRQDCYVEYLDVEAELRQDLTMTVTETWSVLYNEELHGFRRQLPEGSASEGFRVSDVTASGDVSTVESTGGYYEIVFGSEEKTVTGTMEYVITYEVDMLGDYEIGYDRVVSEIMPTGMELFICNAAARIRLPEGISPADITLYVGEQGTDDTDGARFLLWGDTVYIHADKVIRPGNGMRMVLDFADGTFESDDDLAEFMQARELNNPTARMMDESLYVNNYDVDITISSDRTLSVTENIEVMFNEEMHGFQRFIPTYGAEEMYRITNVSASGAKARITQNPDEVHIRLGDEDETVTGIVNYVIKYDVEYFSDITADGDRIYHNIFPHDLENYVCNASATITLPAGAELQDMRVYVGSYGTTYESGAKFHEADGVVYIYSEKILRPGNGATVELLLPEGTFTAREADVIVNDADIDMTVSKDGSFALTQKLFVTVPADSSCPELSVWQTVSMDDRYHQNEDAGVDGCKTHITVNGSTVMKDDEISDYYSIDLSEFKGQTVKVEGLYTGRFAVRGFSCSGAFKLFTRFIPIRHGSDSFVEYKNVTITGHMPTLSADRFDGYFAVNTGSNSKEYYFEEEDTSDGFTAKLVGTLPVGELVWVDFNAAEGAVTRSMNLMDIIAVLAGIGLVIFTAFKASGAPQKTVVPTMEFYPPAELNPAEVGYIIDGKADSKDLTSLIYYWASQGHLSIEMTGKTKYTLHKLSDLDERHKNYERTMFNRLWSLGGNDGTVTSGQLSERFYPTLNKATQLLVSSFETPGWELEDTSRKKLAGSLRTIALVVAAAVPVLAQFVSRVATGNEYIAAVIGVVAFLAVSGIASSKRSGHTLRPKSARAGINIVLIVVSLVAVLLYAAASGGVAVGFISALILGVGACVSLAIAPSVRRTTDLGVDLLGRCQGFKQFLKTAEKERIEMLLEENPEYYYDILPYAQVLGVSSIWEEKFKGLETPPPSWFYGTDVNTTTARYLMMRNMTSANTVMRSMPVSTGSGGGRGGFGGFSGGGGSFGGGFSGGGGGGGGGGGW